MEVIQLKLCGNKLKKSNNVERIRGDDTWRQGKIG